MSRLVATMSCIILVVCAGAVLAEARGEVPAPADTRTLYSLHGVGTQNYTALQNGTYKNTGAVADLYNGSMKTARHFFDAAGTPHWEIFDPATGTVLGTVQGAVKAQAARERQQNDGGFGSVDALLLTASKGTGVLSGATYIQRLNPLGGVLPHGLYALPAYSNSIPNFQAAIPYQADYVFLGGGLPYDGGRRRMAHFQKRLHHPATPDDTP